MFDHRSSRTLILIVSVIALAALLLLTNTSSASHEASSQSAYGDRQDFALGKAEMKPADPLRPSWQSPAPTVVDLAVGRQLLLTNGIAPVVMERDSERDQTDFPSRSDASPAQTGTIAFESDRNGNYDIFAQQVGATGGATPLVVGSDADVTPEWSPDGTKILYASDRDGDYDIYVRTLGGQEQKLTNNTADDAHPAWSPAGDRIIFTSDRGGDYFQIYTMRANGSDVRQVGAIPNNHAMHPRYSPNGNRVVFMRASAPLPACQWNWDVWTMDTNGGNQQRVTNNLGADLYPRWLPDGSQIVYASCRNFLDFDLYTVNPVTGAERRLTSWFLANEWAASYAPDGQHLAFSTDYDGNTEIYTMPAVGGAASNLTRHSADDLAPSWKPTAGGIITPTPAPTMTPTATRTPTPSATPTPLTDLSIHHIESVQVFVDNIEPYSGTPVPLIAQKETMVRIFVRVERAAYVSGVSAHLHVRDAQGTEHVLTNPVIPWPVTVRQSPDRYQLYDTINFRPPPDWMNGTVQLWAEVDPDNRVQESDETNNSGGHRTEVFVPGHRLQVAWVRIGYRDNGNIYYPDLSTMIASDDLMRRMFPVGQNDVDYFEQTGGPVIVAATFPHEAYFGTLNAFWEEVDAGNSWVGGSRPDRLVGWVPAEARMSGAVCGQAEPSRIFVQGRIVVLAEACDKWFPGSPQVVTVPVSEVLAHELGHLLNWNELKHTPSSATDHNCFATPEPTSVNTQYPTYPTGPQGTIGGHGLDIRRNQILRPQHTYDFMSYCKPSWMSPYNYLKLNGGFSLPRSIAYPVADPPDSTRKLIVSGAVLTPTLQTTFAPFYAYVSDSPIPAEGNGDFCLEAQTSSGVPVGVRCFDLSFVQPETYEPMNSESFVFTIPFPANATRVALRHRGTTIASRTASPHSPAVTLVFPNGGQLWAGTGSHTIQWIASDQDGDSLYYIITYSADGGATWIPIATDLTDTHYDLDVSRLPGGTTVLLRVGATDGLNTTYDVSDAPLSVGRKPPFPTILAPEFGAAIHPGANGWLEGRAYDLEDGILGDTALRWTSNRDGALGTGRLRITTLSPGAHTLTLTATDSNGASASATVNLYAGTRLFLPLSLQDR